MTELSWSWPQIASTLMWKLAPRGVVLTRNDLGALPMDRVMLIERTAQRIQLAFVSIKEAIRVREVLARTDSPAGLSALEARWEKIAAVMLWKLRKGGITLTPWDLNQVPHDKQILAHGHRGGVEFAFVPNSQAERLTRWDRDNERSLIVEAIR